MKKLIWITAGILAVAVLALSLSSPVLAADPAQGGPWNGGQGGRGRGFVDQDQDGICDTCGNEPREMNINLDGALQDYLHGPLAEALGIPAEDLTARRDSGETLAEIALDLGFDLTEIRDMFSDTRSDALDSAVVDGILTQEEADWLSSRGRGNRSGVPGAGRFNGKGNCLQN
ncbi:MAG: hypothetical protein U5K99_00565 [Anaerolineales bacterium]|nr:hypothetical protein [Anaerolineales bacterium]